MSVRVRQQVLDLDLIAWEWQSWHLEQHAHRAEFLPLQFQFLFWLIFAGFWDHGSSWLLFRQLSLPHPSRPKMSLGSWTNGVSRTLGRLLAPTSGFLPRSLERQRERESGGQQTPFAFNFCFLRETAKRAIRLMHRFVGTPGPSKARSSRRRRHTTSMPWQRLPTPIAGPHPTRSGSQPRVLAQEATHPKQRAIHPRRASKSKFQFLI